MNIEMQRVQVATRVSVDPIPGILVCTDMGDVIVAFEPITYTLGVHAPDEMRMSVVNDIIAAISESAREEDEFPFKDFEDKPMIFEDSFLWVNIG